MRRRFMAKPPLKTQDYYVINSGTQIVPTGFSYLSIFLVGGGGGGASCGTKHGRCGDGGNGGECLTVEDIAVNSGDKISITIGVGGTGGTTRNNTSDATDGGDTSVTVGGKTYTARGGSGGLTAYQRYDLSMGQPSVGNLGGDGDTYLGQGKTGKDGTVNPLDVYNKSLLYGASGAGGSYAMTNGGQKSVSGGVTGGGKGGGLTDSEGNMPSGSDGTFYGAGGGGAGFVSSSVIGGNGKQGRVFLLFKSRK